MYFLTGLVKIMDDRKQTGRKSVVRKRAIISFNDKHPKLRWVKPAWYNVVHGDSDDLTESDSFENGSTESKSVVRKTAVKPFDGKHPKCSGRICFI